MTSSNKTSDGAENVPQPTRTAWFAAVLAAVIFSAFAFVFVGVYEQDRSLTERERAVRDRENKVQEREEAEAEEARRVRALREQTSRLKAERTGLQDAVARLSGERAELAGNQDPARRTASGEAGAGGELETPRLVAPRAWWPES